MIETFLKSGACGLYTVHLIIEIFNLHHSLPCAHPERLRRCELAIRIVGFRELGSFSLRMFTIESIADQDFRTPNLGFLFRRCISNFYTKQIERGRERKQFS